MATFSADIDQYSLKEFSATAEGLGWEIDFSRCAILLHDLLPYYLKVLPAELTEEVIHQNQQLVDFAREKDIPLICSAPRAAHTLHQRGLGARLWGLGPAEEEAHTFALEGLDEPEVPCMRKRSLSAFFATDLETELRRQKCDQLIISGVFTAGGILATSFDALARDIEVFVVADACADFTRKRHADALHQIATTTGEVVPLSAVLEG